MKHADGTTGINTKAGETANHGVSTAGVAVTNDLGICYTNRVCTCLADPQDWFSLFDTSSVQQFLDSSWHHRIHFMMNNVSALNIDTKALELRDKIYPQYADWFANYIVVKRAAQVSDLHSHSLCVVNPVQLLDFSLARHSVGFECTGLCSI